MKKKHLTSSGLIVLSIAGVIAARSAKPSSIAPAIYYTKGSAASCTILYAINLSPQFTTASTGTSALMKGVSGVVHTLWATSTCTVKKVYFKP